MPTEKEMRGFVNIHGLELAEFFERQHFLSHGARLHTSGLKAELSLESAFALFMSANTSSSTGPVSSSVLSSFFLFNARFDDEVAGTCTC